MRGADRPIRPLFWVASSKRDYGGFPEVVQDGFGFELFLVQTGQHPPSAKPLKCLGAGVFELVGSFDGNAYRAVYAVRFREAVYVLHAFKKKSKRGAQTPKPDIADKATARRGGRRSRQAIWQGQQAMSRAMKIEADGGNIFADLGLPDAGTHLLKAEIVSEIYRLAAAKKMTQAQVGKRLDISQPEVSRMFKGHFREYSIERLMEFLTSFDRDVEIVVRPRKKSGKKSGRIIFRSGQKAA